MKTSEQIKKDFPIFDNANFAYLDSGATSQKPKCVINAVDSFYKTSNANAHRGAYSLGIKSTQIYEGSRHKVAQFLNSAKDDQIIFTKNCTEALNLFAYSYGLDNLKKGDEVVLSIMEHHSLIVPMQRVCGLTGATLKYMYINSDYQINDCEIEQKITKNTKIVGISSVSNVLGTINNYQKIIQRAHSVGAVVLVDISQSIAHMPFDVQKTDADFVAFSAHKMFGPLGIGVLYGKEELLNKMTPFLRGGDMIEYVYEDSATFAPLPSKFEAGTQNVGGALGLATAIDYINSLGYDNIQAVELDVLKYAMDRLSKLPFITLYCTNDISKHSSVISFNVKGVHPHDVASILDMDNVFVRAGDHCAQPLIRFLKIDGTCRASFSVYNTKSDVDKLVEALQKVYNTFKKYINN